MGSSIHRPHSEGASCQPPRDLSSLLIEIRVPEDIDRCLWAKKFRDHLQSLNRTDLEAMLDFVIVCNVLRNKESEVRQCRNIKWRQNELNKERRELLRMLGDSFFSEHSDNPIPLANQVLREELWHHLSSIDEHSDEAKLSQAFDLVWQARSDHRVWRAGLDAAYTKFIAQSPALPLTAVLLSII